MLLENKVVLITGCNRGIGKAILKEFSRNGAVIYANARTGGSLDEMEKELSDQYHVQITPVYFDITDTQAVKNCMMRIRQEQKRLDCLVNNAGIMKDGLISMMDEHTISNMFELNVLSAIRLIQYAVKLMSRQKSGSIINMASIAGESGVAGQAVYSATKGAVIALTKALAKELSPQGIRINAIAPGIIDTDLIKNIAPDKIQENITKISLGRLGYPEEIAKAAAFLASEQSSYITGEILNVNGGIII